MHVDTIKLQVRELAIGMQVVKLDRPWLGTPFVLQGFRISSAEELRQLAEHCSYVYVEVKSGVSPAAGRGELVTLNEEGDVVEIKRSVSALSARERDSDPGDPAALPRMAVNYELQSDFSDELPVTRAALAATKAAVKALMDAVREGRRAPLTAVREAAVALEDSMLRNPDPAMLARALSDDEPFSFRHCVNSTILAISMGRALGLRRPVLHELTMGMLLADIGKLRLPRAC